MKQSSMQRLNEMLRILDLMDFEAQLMVNKQEAPSLPSKFVSFDSQWRTFSEGLMGHFKVVHGCMNIPKKHFESSVVAKVMR
jgi:hypothetical protein